MYKDILVHVDTSDACATRLEVAIGLAKAHDARVKGLYVRNYPKVPKWVVVQLGPDVVEVQKQYAVKAMEQAEEAFRKALGRKKVDVSWCAADGDLIDSVVTHGRYADLIILSRLETGKAADAEKRLIAQVAMEVGRPVLVLPPGYAGGVPGKSVLIAWDGSREAARAVSDAMPVLRKAKTVMVSAVADPDDEVSDCIPDAAAALVAHLAAQGVEAKAMARDGHDSKVGKTLLVCAEDAKADLIVMGAYGRSRLRDLVLGGTTRYVLKHTTLPILMSH